MSGLVHCYRYSFLLPSSLHVGDAMTRRPLVLTLAATVEQATHDGLSGAPVVASNGV
jgi:hypothetical protein